MNPATPREALASLDLPGDLAGDALLRAIVALHDEGEADPEQCRRIILALTAVMAAGPVPPEVLRLLACEAVLRGPAMEPARALLRQLRS